MSKNTEKILHSLEDLFKEAESTDKWFYSIYCVWFSPAELKEEHRKGKFIWGPLNWTLRDPQEKLAELGLKLDESLLKYKEFQVRIKEG